MVGFVIDGRAPGFANGANALDEEREEMRREERRGERARAEKYEGTLLAKRLARRET